MIEEDLRVMATT